MKRSLFCLMACAALAAGAMPMITMLAKDAVVPTLKPGHKEFLALSRAERRARFEQPACREDMVKKVGDRPAKIVLAWTGAKGNVAVTVCEADGKQVFATNAVDLARVEIANLLINRKYQWRVKDAEGVAESTFSTEDIAPRVIDVSRIPNLRDLGGRVGLNGRRVKQGMIYRSAGLNDNAKTTFLSVKQIEKARADGTLEQVLAGTTDMDYRPTDVKAYLKKIDYHVKKSGGVPERYGKRLLLREGSKPGRARLTPATRAYMTETLGIKTDIDLRTAAECYGMTESPLGPDVKWVHVSSSAYGGMSEERARDSFKKVFKVFLDEANYPIDFHCIAGADRTGAVGFILNGLLGVCEEELYRDWEFTAFCTSNLNFTQKDRFDHLVKVFDKYPGDTVNARIEAYVLSLGFTKDDIAKFRGIMLE